MFSHEVTAQLFQQHSNEETETSSLCRAKVVSSIHETETWKSWYNTSGIHCGEQRAISFGICTDGLNPFSKEKGIYSMWPIILFPLTFPPT